MSLRLFSYFKALETNSGKIETLKNNYYLFSSPKNSEEYMQIKFYTNSKTHSVCLDKDHALKFFVEIKLNSIPVNEARVLLKIKVTRHLTNEQNHFEMELFDNGNGKILFNLKAFNKIFITSE